MEEVENKDTTWYKIVLFPGKGSLTVVWYETGRLGAQGKAPRGERVTLEAVLDSFVDEWEEGEEGVRMD